jgi:hypothetical protein
LRLLAEQLEAVVKKSADTKDKEVMIELSAENFHRTGIRTDLVQQVKRFEMARNGVLYCMAYFLTLSFTPYCISLLFHASISVN